MMNREIKFRAWDGKEMLYSEKAQFYLMPDNKVDVPSSTGHEFYKRDYPLMQYTGLKDKNGKEIYEGDILHHPLNERWFDWLIEIIDGSNKLINIGIDGYRHDPMLLIQQSASARIIIGNIYENPELLK